MCRWVELRCIASLVVLAAAGCGGDGTRADVECVENLCPCDEGGIRAAIKEGPGLYSFDCNGPSTVVIRDEIVIDRDVSLDGGGNLSVDGNRAHRVFSVPEGVTADLIALTVTNGRQTEEHGAGIRNEGTLTLTNSSVAGSSAGRDSGCRTDDPALLCSEGGGIWNTGTLTLINSSVLGNSAHFGGGIANRGGSLTLIDSEVLTNSAQGCRGVGAVVCSGGGGIWNSGTLTILNSAVSGSTADWGAGVYNRDALTLTRSTVSGNSAGFDGGGLLNFERLALIETTVTDNAAGQSGGGVANEAGMLQVTHSTLSGNTAASAGGGIFNPGGAAAELVNTTVSGNNAGSTGGAVYTGGELFLLSSTIAGNDASSAAAIYVPENVASGPGWITNALIEGECVGPPFNSGGYNVESPGDSCGFDQTTDLPAQDQLNLGRLEDNGGPTKTIALLENSVAIDRIPEADCVDGGGEPLTTDQRGEPRPAGGSSSCDVGAFEAQR